MSIGNVAVIDPRFTPIEQWSSLMAAALLQFGPVPRSTTEKEWRIWAQYVRSLPELSALGIPDPRQYTDWREWALRFNHTLFMGG